MLRLNFLFVSLTNTFSKEIRMTSYWPVHKMDANDDNYADAYGVVSVNDKGHRCIEFNLVSEQANPNGSFNHCSEVRSDTKGLELGTKVELKVLPVENYKGECVVAKVTPSAAVA